MLGCTVHKLRIVPTSQVLTQCVKTWPLRRAGAEETWSRPPHPSLPPYPTGGGGGGGAELLIGPPTRPFDPPYVGRGTDRDDGPLCVFLNRPGRRTEHGLARSGVREAIGALGFPRVAKFYLHENSRRNTPRMKSPRPPVPRPTRPYPSIPHPALQAGTPTRSEECTSAGVSNCGDFTLNTFCMLPWAHSAPLAVPPACASSWLQRVFFAGHNDIGSRRKPRGLCERWW